MAKEGGDHLPGTFGARVPLAGDGKYSPTARGRMLRLERKKLEQKAPSERRLTSQEGDSNPGPATRQCTELPLGHTAIDLHGGPGV